MATYTYAEGTTWTLCTYCQGQGFVVKVEPGTSQWRVHNITHSAVGHVSSCPVCAGKGRVRITTRLVPPDQWR